MDNTNPKDIHNILEKCKNLMNNELDKLVQRQIENGPDSLKFSEGKIVTEYTKTLQGLSKNKLLDNVEENLAESASSDELIAIAKQLIDSKK